MSSTNRCDTQSSRIPTEEDEGNFQVFVRVRPLKKQSDEILSGNGYRSTDANLANANNAINRNAYFSPLRTQQPLNSQQSVIRVDEDQQQLYVSDPEYKSFDKREKPYCFNGVLGEKSTNYDIYNKIVLPNLDAVFQGFNATFLAYGITGSGKTHTIFGRQGNEDSDKGICYLTYQYLLKKFAEDEKNMNQQRRTFFRFSYMEIYNENVRDLLSYDTQKSLTIIEDTVKGGVVVQDLNEFIVRDIGEIDELIRQGNQKRVLAPTSANQYSSRSHAILLLNIETRNLNKLGEGLDEIITSKLTFIDLAGSEKGTSEKQWILEGANINKSLLALGNCINIIADNKRNSFVPYRDSKLTRLLKDSLGGNTKTVMIACISQSMQCFEETINTLNYAQRATIIKRKITKNTKEEEYHPNQYREIIKNLKRQLEFYQKIAKQPVPCPCCGYINKELAAPAKDQGTIIQRLNTQDSQDLDALTDFNRRLTEDTEFLYKQRSEKLQSEKTNLKQQIIQLSEMLNVQENTSQAFYQENEQSNQNNLQNKEEYISRVVQDIVINIEEQMEIQQSLRELEQTLQADYAKIQQISSCLNNHSQNYPDQNNNIQIQELYQIAKENEEIKERMISALAVNNSQKEILKELLLKMNQDSKQIQMEADMKIRKQQLEGLELLQGNNELVHELHIKNKSITEKDSIIAQLEQELSTIKQIELINQQKICELNNQITTISNTINQSRQQQLQFQQFENAALVPQTQQQLQILQQQGKVTPLNNQTVQEGIDKNSMLTPRTKEIGFFQQTAVSPITPQNRKNLSLNQTNSTANNNVINNNSFKAHLSNNNSNVSDRQKSPKLFQQQLQPLGTTVRLNKNTNSLVSPSSSSRSPKMHTKMLTTTQAMNKENTTLSQQQQSFTSTSSTLFIKKNRSPFKSPQSVEVQNNKQFNKSPLKSISTEVLAPASVTSTGTTGGNVMTQSNATTAQSGSNNSFFSKPNLPKSGDASIKQTQQPQQQQQLQQQQQQQSQPHQQQLQLLLQPQLKKEPQTTIIELFNNKPEKTLSSPNICAGMFGSFKSSRSNCKSGSRYETSSENLVNNETISKFDQIDQASSIPLSQQQCEQQNRILKECKNENGAISSSNANSQNTLQLISESLYEKHSQLSTEVQRKSKEKVLMISPVDSLNNPLQVSSSSKKVNGDSSQRYKDTTVGTNIINAINVQNNNQKNNINNELQYSQKNELKQQNTFLQDLKNPLDDEELTSRDSHCNSNVKDKHQHQDSAIKNPLETDDNETDADRCSEKVSIVGSPQINKSSRVMYQMPYNRGFQKFNNLIQQNNNNFQHELNQFKCVQIYQLKYLFN